MGPTRRDAAEEVGFSLEELRHDGRGGRVTLVREVEARAEVHVGQDGVEGESGLLLLREFPRCLLRQGLAGGIHGQRALGLIGRVAIGDLDGLVGPCVGRHGERGVGLGDHGGDGGRCQDKAFHAGLLGGGGERVEGAGDRARDHVVRVRV